MLQFPDEWNRAAGKAYAVRLELLCPDKYSGIGYFMGVRCFAVLYFSGGIQSAHVKACSISNPQKAAVN